MDPELKALVDTLLESDKRSAEQLAALKQKVDAIRAIRPKPNGEEK